jgi:hypothetical protein
LLCSTPLLCLANTSAAHPWRPRRIRPPSPAAIAGGRCRVVFIGRVVFIKHPRRRRAQLKSPIYAAIPVTPPGAGWWHLLPPSCQLLAPTACHQPSLFGLAVTPHPPESFFSRSSRFFLRTQGQRLNIYRTRAVAGIGSACGPGASPTPDLRESARAVPRTRKYRRGESFLIKLTRFAC